MNKHDLTVRGEKIHIEFERINDSRRMSHYKFVTHKNPNLFKIKAAMGCRVDMPIALCPEWCKAHSHDTFSFMGMGLCFYKDEWSAKKGRHRSLAEALTSFDKALNAEITVAFSVEETRRTKVKGPARIPKTAKPKPRRRSTLERIADALEKLANPMQVVEMSPSEIDAACKRIMPGRNIRPADNGRAPVSFLWPCPKCRHFNEDSREHIVICAGCGATFEDLPTINQPYVADPDGIETIAANGTISKGE